MVCGAVWPTAMRVRLALTPRCPSALPGPPPPGKRAPPPPTRTAPQAPSRPHPRRPGPPAHGDRDPGAPRCVRARARSAHPADLGRRGRRPRRPVAAPRLRVSHRAAQTRSRARRRRGRRRRLGPPRTRRASAAVRRGVRGVCGRGARALRSAVGRGEVTGLERARRVGRARRKLARARRRIGRRSGRGAHEREDGRACMDARARARMGGRSASARRARSRKAGGRARRGVACGQAARARVGRAHAARGRRYALEGGEGALGSLARREACRGQLERMASRPWRKGWSQGAGVRRQAGLFRLLPAPAWRFLVVSLDFASRASRCSSDASHHAGRTVGVRARNGLVAALSLSGLDFDERAARAARGRRRRCTEPARERRRRTSGAGATLDGIGQVASLCGALETQRRLDTRGVRVARGFAACCVDRFAPEAPSAVSGTRAATAGQVVREAVSRGGSPPGPSARARARASERGFGLYEEGPHDALPRPRAPTLGRAVRWSGHAAAPFAFGRRVGGAKMMFRVQAALWLAGFRGERAKGSI